MDKLHLFLYWTYFLLFLQDVCSDSGCLNSQQLSPLVSGRGGWSRTRELTHNVQKQYYGLKFASNNIKVDHKCNRSELSTPFMQCFIMHQ